MRYCAIFLSLCASLGIEGASRAQDANTIPPEFQKQLAYFDGAWTGTWTYSNGESMPENATRRPILGGRFSVITGNAGPTQFHIVSGWDAATQTLTDVVFLSDGSRITEAWTVKEDGEWFTLTSNTVGVTGDGRKFTSQNSVRIVSKDEYIYEAKNSEVDGVPQPGFQAVLKRQGGPADNKASKEQFTQLGDKLVGHWVSEFESDVAAEGVCEVGDKIVQSTSFEWVSSQTALLEKRVYKIGDKTIAEGVALISWDEPRKEIKSAYCDSLGGSWQSVWRKRGKTFVVQDRGVFGDGRKSVGRNIVSFSDGGKTLTYKLTQRVFGDQTFPDKEFTHHKVQE